MASLSASATAPARAPRPVPPRRHAVSSRRALTGSIVWIALLAVLLAGVVALNVAVLRLNIALDRSEAEQSDLRAQNAALASQLSRAGAAPRIEAQARRAGLVPAEDTGFLRLTP